MEGVSTRKVKEITEELCGTSFSKSLVSSLAGSLDSELEGWRNRALEAEAYPYVFVDARYEKVRMDHRIVSQGVLIVSAVREPDGLREILAVEVADTESEAAYQELFRSLKARGLSGVELVLSDEHEGIKAAVARHFQGASHQRCQVHYSRNLLGMVGANKRKELGADLRGIFAAPERHSALGLASSVAQKWREKGHEKPGEGEALWWFGVLATIKITAEQTSGQYALVEILAPDGYEGVLHVHHFEDEGFYILEGELTFYVGDQTIKAHPGSYLFGPKDVPHAFTVDSGPAKLLFVFSPAGLEAGIREMGEPARSLTVPPQPEEPPDEAEMERLAAIGAWYGAEIIGPPPGQ